MKQKGGVNAGVVEVRAPTPACAYPPEDSPNSRRGPRAAGAQGLALGAGTQARGNAGDVCMCVYVLGVVVINHRLQRGRCTLGTAGAPPRVACTASLSVTWGAGDRGGDTEGQAKVEMNHSAQAMFTPDPGREGLRNPSDRAQHLSSKPRTPFP